MRILVLQQRRGGQSVVVTIKYFSPAPALRQYVSSYYWFETDVPFLDLLRAELGQLRFRVEGSSCFRFADGIARDCPAAMLTGPTVSPVEFSTTGPLKAFGAGLLPAGWAALIGADADVYADGCVDFAAFEPAATDACLGAMCTAADDAARVAAADGFFATLASRARAVPLWFTRLADDWLTASPSPQVDALVAASRLCPRQVERLSRRIYGASPKLLARKYRALQAAVRLGNGDAHGWADAAGDAFYDQSHFIREFKAFVGMTPHRFAHEAAPLSHLTMARRRLLPGLPRLALIS